MSQYISVVYLSVYLSISQYISVCLSIAQCISVVYLSILTCGVLTQHTDLELESMRQKCDAWKQEVNDLAPFRDRACELEVQCSELQRDIDQVRSENTDLRANLVRHDRKKMATPGSLSLSSSSAEFDELMRKFTELKNVRAALENELAPLRAERATILRENAALREGEQPEKYARLKEEYTDLVQQFGALQADVQEKESLLYAHQDSNYQMQQMLDEATDPEKLQSIRERMERYKNERDKARQQADELQQRLTEVEMEYDEKASEQVQQLLSESDQTIAEMEHKLSQQDEQMKTITTRFYRYREERNSSRALCKELENRVATLEETITHLVEQSKMSEAQSYNTDSGGFDTLDLEPQQQQQQQQRRIVREHSLSPGLEHSTPHVQDYNEQNYAVGDEEEEVSNPQDQYDFATGELPDSPVGRLERSLSELSDEVVLSKHRGSASKPKRQVPSGGEVGFGMVHVKTKDGIAETYIQKPGLLSSKYKPRVVVKRSDGEFEAGTLMFTGVVNGKEIAGIHMDLKSTRES